MNIPIMVGIAGWVVLTALVYRQADRSFLPWPLRIHHVDDNSMSPDSPPLVRR